MREALEALREAEYFNEDGLRTLTGLDDSRWDFAVFKELLDNALDAIDELNEKRIDIKIDNGMLAVQDNGKGISEEILDSIFDFSKYVSSKRFIKSPTRGFQGNALKTVIGVCYLRRYSLLFFSGGKQISYKLNETKIQAGIVHFEKQVQRSKNSTSIVSVKGIQLDPNEMRRAVWTYRFANPDVTFHFNSEVFEAVTEPIKRTEKSFIHWYDLSSFNSLLQAVHQKNPDRTVREFIQTFSGTQRLRLNFPHKRLSDFSGDMKAVEQLYNELKSSTKKPRPEILKMGITGRDTLFKIYGESKQDKYKVICGGYQSNEAVVPFVIEGFLLYSNDNDCKVMTSVNSSIPYEDIPFCFDLGHVEFCKKEYWIDSLESLLNQSGFINESEGLTLYLNFISPHIEFTDKSKTQIISHKFKNRLIDLAEYLCKDAIKEIRKTRREQRQFDRERAISPGKRESKVGLMGKYFEEGYRISSGGFKVVVRQIFYAIRNILNIRHGVDLNKSDYNNVFTQEIVTKYIENHPEFEDKILFERRGYFYNPFDDHDLALGTQDVVEFINKVIQNRIFQKVQTFYSIPDELKFNHVLFVEKAGFNIILKDSGLLNRLNLGVMSTAGFGTRAVKRLIKYFFDRGIKVYILTDCDIAGYLISDKFKMGSKTFKEPLAVTKIGLTLEDVDLLNKRTFAEKVQYKKSYKGSLDILTPEEYKFLVIDEKRNLFRRVELNTLTSPELISFIESKIKYKTIKPTIKQLKDYLEIDETDIIKRALFEAYGRGLKANIDIAKLAGAIHKRINGNERWINTMVTVRNEYTQNKVDGLVKQLLHRKSNAL